MIADGILVLNKPKDWTSHDCVAVCRRVLRLKGIKKIGHGGTLDPMAEGVLPIFIGQATRIMEYLELDNKRYTCEMQLGLVTDTQDIWGTVLQEHPWDGITRDQILRELDAFRGSIEQMPPIYSAVRIDGKHLYEYARKGRIAPDVNSLETEAKHNEGVKPIKEEPTEKSQEESILERVKPRKVYIYDLVVEDIDLEKGRIRFSVECSKGTYIRTICDDLGRRLGCGGAMCALKRTAIGRIDLSHSISPEEIKAMGLQESSARDTKSKESVNGAGDRPPQQSLSADADERLSELLLPTDAPLMRFGEIRMPEDRAHYFRQGNSIWLNQVKKIQQPQIDPDPLTGEIPRNARGRRYDRIYRVYQQGTDLFLGTGYEDREKGVLKADKIFMALNEPKSK